jgi:hypothetical protein
MKKLFTFISLLLSLSLFSQKGMILQEDFSSDQFSDNGWTIDAQSSNWSAKFSSNAGGTAPEAALSWSPQFNGDSRLISPIIDATNITNLRIAFKHSLDHYGSGYEVGLATTSDGGSTWNTAWSTGGADETAALDIEITNDLSSSSFQFCFYFSGDSYQINNWYLDDIMVYAPEQVDAMAASVDMASYAAPGNFYMKATITNIGLDEITSFDGHYNVNNYFDIDQSFSNVSIPTGESYEVEFASFYPLAAGDHNVKIWINNINGEGDDNDISNDTVEKVLHIATQTTTNFPLYEEFTSSTCGPCASFNSSAFTPFLNNHVGELAIIKYQMSWPSPGDPYYTEEGGVRRAFYGVSAVPQLFAGGIGCATNGTAVDNALADLTTKDAFMTLSAHHQVDVDNSLISVYANFTPFVNGSDFVIHAVVSEKKTTENVASNGETEFHHVMMKMLPDAQGTPLNLTAETPQSIEFTDIDLSGTNIEEMTDLEVTVFIQNTTTKEIFQSVNSVEGVSANRVVTFRALDEGTPIEGVTVSTNLENLTTNANGEAAIILEDGTYNYTATIDGYFEVTDSYTIAGQDTTIVLNLSSNGITDVSSVINVYPVPAKNSVVVQGISSNILIYNMSGMLVKSIPAIENKTQIDIYDLEAGTYFIRSSDNSNVGAQKLIVVK